MNSICVAYGLHATHRIASGNLQCFSYCQMSGIYLTYWAWYQWIHKVILFARCLALNWHILHGSSESITLFHDYMRDSLGIHRNRIMFVTLIFFFQNCHTRSTKPKNYRSPIMLHTDTTLTWLDPKIFEVILFNKTITVRHVW